MPIVAIILPLAVAVIGLVIYVLPAGASGSADRKEIGRQLMFCGFFFTVYVLALKQIKL